MCCDIIFTFFAKDTNPLNETLIAGAPSVQICT
jgi:hypothetical protein